MGRKYPHRLAEISPKQVQCKICKKEFHKNIDHHSLTVEECHVRLRMQLDSILTSEEDLKEEYNEVVGQYDQLSLRFSEQDREFQILKDLSIKINSDWSDIFNAEVSWSKNYRILLQDIDKIISEFNLSTNDIHSLVDSPIAEFVEKLKSIPVEIKDLINQYDIQHTEWIQNLANNLPEEIKPDEPS